MMKESNRPLPNLVSRVFVPLDQRSENESSGSMRHRYRLRSETGWTEFGYLCYSKWLLPELSFPSAGQGERRLWERDWLLLGVQLVEAQDKKQRSEKRREKLGARSQRSLAFPNCAELRYRSVRHFSRCVST